MMVSCSYGELEWVSSITPTEALQGGLQQKFQTCSQPRHQHHSFSLVDNSPPNHDDRIA